MSEIINCLNCGATNQLPQGKSSMFCAYCGSKVEIGRSVENLKKKSKIKKSKILDGNLSYKARDIDTISEITDLYSDSELEQISNLCLTENNILNLNGIQRFTLEKFDLSKNQIENIDKLPNFSVHYEAQVGGSVEIYQKFELNLSGNAKLKGFNETVINELNDKSKINFISINIRDCNNFDINQLTKINFLKILNSKVYSSPRAEIFCNNDLDFPTELKSIGFVGQNGYWYFENNKQTPKQTINKKKGSYDHQDVKEFRNFRDKIKFKLSVTNWIQLLSPQIFAIIFLNVVGSESKNIIALFFEVIYLTIDLFLPQGIFSYWRCLSISNIIIILLMIAPFLSYQRKTGRSFHTKYGKIDEYETVESKFVSDSMMR
jgi:DNA-directed RNA polymerase subunit RPC12/RpoP